ncbi:MAG TPA: hypothetical protein PLB55_10595 [Prosthecobacter sp.]|jgi:hypothetical protein|nr:hypothetical protein [Prosthecobacter sp.]
MNTRSLFFSLLFATTPVMAADPPKLVPRPIPGMAAPTPVKATTVSVKPAAAQQAVSPVVTSTDRARILYIHRRATLPADLTKNLPTSKSDATVSATMLDVRPSAVKIIPKSEVAQIITPKP